MAVSDGEVSRAWCAFVEGLVACQTSGQFAGVYYRRSGSAACPV